MFLGADSNCNPVPLLLPYDQNLIHNMLYKDNKESFIMAVLENDDRLYSFLGRFLFSVGKKGRV